MNVLPPPGPQRTRLYVLVAALAVTAVVFAMRDGAALPPVPATTGPSPASNLSGAPIAAPAPRPGGRVPQAAGQTPQALKLDQIEQVPEEPEAGRNLFRFGMRPAPPPPTPVYQPPPPPPPPPGPPPIPPIPLRLRALMDDPYGKKRAYLLDQTGAIHEAVEGQVVDGRYRLLKIGANSVVMSYLDGTGQRTITLGGG